MENLNVLKILKCIHCGHDKLTFIAETSRIVCTNCKHEYTISKNVSEMLPEEENSGESKSEIHEKFGTSFNYIDHYQKDAYTSDYFADRDSGTEHSERRVREYIAAEMDGKQGRILDVGCGKAWVAELFCQKGFEVVSMDISLRNTSKAIKKYPFKNHTAVVADVFALPFKNASFDFIVASEIIEHVQNPGLFVKKLFSVLKPGGKLIVTTPYKEKIQYSLCIHCNRPTPLHAHIHSFDEQKLTTLFSDLELKKVYFKKFGNKFPIHFRMHPILKHLNFSMWKSFDGMMNQIYKVPTRILVVWEKSQDSA